LQIAEDPAALSQEPVTSLVAGIREFLDR